MMLWVEGSHITDSVHEGYNYNKFKKLFSKWFGFFCREKIWFHIGYLYNTGPLLHEN